MVLLLMLQLGLPLPMWPNTIFKMLVRYRDQPSCATWKIKTWPQRSEPSSHLRRECPYFCVLPHDRVLVSRLLELDLVFMYMELMSVLARRKHQAVRERCMSAELRHQLVVKPRRHRQAHELFLV
jgi:hypothetical protein